MKNLYLLVFALIIGAQALVAQNVNVYMDVIELTHNRDCGNDGVLGDNPEPRWRVWGGHSGAIFTANPVCSNNNCCGNGTINGGTRSCGTWNLTDFDLLNVLNQNITQMNVDLQSWEEDDCGGDCDPNTCTFNDDDCRAGRARVMDINFRNDPPCQFNQYGFGFRDCGFGVKVDIYWEYSTVSGGTIGNAQTICYNDNPSAISNTNGGTTAYTNYTWEQQVGCTGAWTVISGATSATYDPANLATTTCFRRRVNAPCGGAFAYSNTITITVLPSFNAGNLTGGGGTFCSPANPGTMTANPTGAAGTYTYQWYSVNGASCPNGGGATIISGATSASYDPPAGLNTTTSYQVQVNPTGTPDCAGATWSNNCITVIVNPTPTATATPSANTICSGEGAGISLSSNVLGTTFAWTASVSGSITGASSGSGSSINHTLTNNGTTNGSVTYTVTPTATGCPGSSIQVVVTVKPTPVVTITNSASAICNNGSTNITLSSNVGGSTFAYTASGSNPNIGGFSNGSGASIGQVLTNSGSVAGTVTYTVTPTANACAGPAVQTVVTVNPVPNVSVTPGISTICSGSQPSVSLTSSVIGTTFSWTASSANPQVSGFSASSGSTINQTLTNNGTVQGTVTYTISTSANSCPGTGGTATVNVNPLPQGSISGTTTICNTGSTNLTFNFLAGTPPYDVIYTDGTNNFNLNDINSGHTVSVSPTIATTYTLVSIIDAAGNGCVRTSGFSGAATISVNPLPVGTISGATTTCSGDATNLTFNFTVGTGPFDVSYSDGTTSYNLVNIPNGHTISVSPLVTTVYSIVSITDDFGCINPSVSSSTTISVDPLPNGSMAVFTPICFGDQTTITFTFTNGTGPFDIAFTDGITNFSLTGVSSGDTYNVTPPTTVTYNYTSITDDNGCIRVSGFAGNAQVIVNPLPIVSFTGLATAYCETGASATLTGNQAPGGVFTGLGITDNGNGTATFNPAVAGVGTHIVTYTFTDINSCTNNVTQSVTVDAQPVANAGAAVNQCDLDYTFSAVPTVGVGIWSMFGGPGSAFFSNANSATSGVQVTAYGTYTFQWSEVNGQCSDSEQISVTFYQQPTVSLGADQTQCQLTYSLTPTTNIPVTSYSWTQLSGPAATIVDNTAAVATIVSSGTLGTYVFEVTVTVNGCSSTDQISITQVGIPVSDAGTGGDECDLNFNLSATPSVGTGTWTQTGGPGFANFVPNAAAANAVVSVSQYGTYQFTWTETNLNCTNASSVSVNFYQQPAANAGTNGNECNLTHVFDAVPSVGNGTWTQISGPGTTSFVNAASATTTATVSQIGQYVYQWEEMNGTCSSAATVTVNYFDQPVANPGFGGSECDLDFQLGAVPSVGNGVWTAQGPGTISFSPTASDPNALATVSAYGIYIFTWSEDNFGCTDSGNITVNFDQQTNANAGNGGDECDLNFTFNGSPSIGAGVWTFAGPGNAFFSNPTSPTATVTVDTYGAYLFTWTETNGSCTATDQVSVNFYQQPVANAGPGGDECDLNFQFAALPSVGNGLWLQTNGPGTSTFTSNTSATSTVTVSQYGTYTYTWTETNGVCSSSATVVVNYYEQPVANAGIGGDECDLDFSLNGAASVGVGLWTSSGPGSATFANDLSASTTVTVSTYGTYTFTWTEINGTCTSAASVIVNFYLQPVAVAGQGGDECDLNFLTSAVPSVGTGLWSQTSGPGTSTFSNASSAINTITASVYGTYEYAWTETNGTCVDFRTITVNYYQQPVADAGLGGDECDFDFTLAANASVGNGTWTYAGPGTATFGSASSASTVVTVSQSGVYTFTWTETNGICSNADNVVVTFYDQPVANAGTGGNECDLNFVFSAVPSFGIGTWTAVGPGSASFTNANSSTSTVSVSSYGTYQFTWTEVNGICSDNATITVNFYQQPVANAGTATNQCDLDFTFNGTASVGVGTWTYTGPGTATFSPNANAVNATVTVSATGSYTFTWTEDNNGCTASANVTIAFNALPVVSFTGLVASYCVDRTTPVPLTGTPAGGTFSGLGISGNAFVPSVAGVGTIILTYTYTDINGCTDSETQSVDVNGLPNVSFSGLSSPYCVDDAVPHTLLGLPAGGTFTGSGISVNQFTASVANIGNHPITYSYTDPFGCSSSQQQVVAVNALPVVTFTGLSAAYCADASNAQLVGTPSGGTFSGTGIVGNAFSPVAAGVGQHTIVYTYTDGNGCTNTHTQQVTVNAVPVPVITPSGSSAICAGTNITLDAGSGYAGYTWSTNANGQSISVGTAGTYNVTVTTTAGCVGTSGDVNISVNPLPIVNLGSDTIVCTGSSFTIDAGNPGMTYSWSTQEISQSITVITTGNYSVNVTDQNGCVGTDQVLVSVSSLLDPVIVAGGPVTFCAGGSVTLDGGAGYTNYQWSTGATSQTITVSTAGLIELTVVDQFGCTGTDDEVVSLLQLPNAVIQPTGPIEICSSDTITLSASNTFVSYQWNLGGQTTSSIEVWQSGDYTVTVVDPNNGCVATSAPVSVTVNNAVSPTIVPSGATEFCNGGSVSLTVVPGPYSEYLWSSGSTTPSIVVTQSGDYGVTVLDGNGCIDSTLLGNPIHIEVWNPEPIIEQQGANLVVVNGPFQQYQWYFNGAPVPGATSVQHTPASSGNYSVEAWDSNGCSGNSFNIEYTFTGITDLSDKYDIRIYPNPTSGFFTLEADFGSRITGTIYLVDITGRGIMAPEKLEEVSSIRRQFDIENLSLGVYYLRLVTEEGVAVKSIIRN
ncbi:MAG: T9SS type A sorting domain-containing protein [Flavobacteriales bacterium]|nr:T9SS type A sorting domain-containing protein [Flavobacteriales bacterium]